ncbi:ABC transport system, permease component (plasmid) [Phenylobacterium zucineum HLK1]|uniref:ABC transport system, permease component n=1 Tax=Phenylobacterium zucineum (strain HLK1) TaxID=450851 RepID=B4RIC3_PHEZH|nr:ABC transport system, permease component [Phenylobacterium zucineum HLK1]
MNLRRLLAFSRKEVLEISRDPFTIGVALFMPVLMLFLFVYGISLDVENAPLVVVDQDKSPASRELQARFLNSGYFKLKAAPDDARSAEHALMRGETRAALFIPKDFGRRLAEGQSAPVQLIVDGTYASSAAILSAYGRAILYAFPGELRSSVRPEVRVWYNPQLRSRNFIVPGLFAVILMAFPPLLTALAVSREKELGTIAQIYASPLTKGEFITGKLLPYAGIAFVELLIVFAGGLLWFQVPVRGSFALLVAVGLLYVVCTVSIGLLVSTLVRTQLAAMLVALILTMMPAFLFSGFVYPIFTMPKAFQVYSAAFPTPYFLDVSRGIVLRGSGLAELWPSILVIAGYTIVVCVLAAWRFNKRIA